MGLSVMHILAIIFFLIAGIFYFSNSPVLALSEYADQVIETCSEKQYPPPCYDEEIPKLIKEGLTMEEMFSVTTIIQEKGQNYWYCHVLGHNLSSQEAAKDLDKWTEVVSRCPIGMCSNGCLHGTFQEKFQEQVLSDEQINELIPDIDTICENSDNRNFTGLEQASCYHALGHLTMYVTNANIEKSVVICNQVAVKGEQSYLQTCYEGAYMQIFQPLEPEDFVLVEEIAPRTIEEALDYCNQFEGLKRGACHRESWPLSREEILTSVGLQKFCAHAESDEQERRCYNALFYVITAQFGFDESRIVPLCNGLSDKRKAQCYANAASRYIETDYRLSNKASALCALAEGEGVGDRCYEELLFYSTFNFHPGSESFTTLCNTLPSPWNTRCLSEEGRRMLVPRD